MDFLSSLSSLFVSPKQLDGTPNNMFDKLSKDLNAPFLKEFLGADAVAKRKEDADVTKAKKKKLADATGFDIEAFTSKNLPTKQVGSTTGKEILKAVLAGKPASSIFGGDT